MRAAVVIAAELIALPPRPFAAGPALDLEPADLLRQVHALEPRPDRGHALERVELEPAVRAMRDRDRRRAFFAHQPGQRPRIDPGDPNAAPLPHPVGEALVRAVVAG